LRDHEGRRSGVAHGRPAKATHVRFWPQADIDRLGFRNGYRRKEETPFEPKSTSVVAKAILKERHPVMQRTELLVHNVASRIDLDASWILKPF